MDFKKLLGVPVATNPTMEVVSSGPNKSRTCVWELLEYHGDLGHYWLVAKDGIVMDYRVNPRNANILYGIYLAS